MKKSENRKSISNLENQKVDSDQIIGGRKQASEGLVRGNDKFAATRTQNGELPGKAKLRNSANSKINPKGKI